MHSKQRKKKSHAFIHAFKNARKNSHAFKKISHAFKASKKFLCIKSKDEFLNNGFMTLSRTQSCISSEERTQSRIFT